MVGWSNDEFGKCSGKATGVGGLGLAVIRAVTRWWQLRGEQRMGIATGVFFAAIGAGRYDWRVTA
jgi:hypothetical protein